MALAIFDLDETLINGDCASLWSEQMARLGWVDGKEFLRRDHELMEAYGKGHLQMEDYMAFSLEPIAGRTLEEVEHLIEPWVEDVIEPIIYGDACRCIAEHRQKGDRILIISASGTHLVGPIASRLGVDESAAGAIFNAFLRDLHPASAADRRERIAELEQMMEQERNVAD